jgi:hypothetical protein
VEFAGTRRRLVVTCRANSFMSAAARRLVDLFPKAAAAAGAALPAA